MPKKTTEIQDSVAALHSPEAQRIERDAQRAAQAKDSSAGNTAKDVKASAKSDPSQDATKQHLGGSLGGLRSKLQNSNNPTHVNSVDDAVLKQGKERDTNHSAQGTNISHAPEPLFPPVASSAMENDSVRPGDLRNLIRLETGKDRLLVNHKKLTEKITKMLHAIEAQENYLETIAQKVTQKRHRGIVIDLPKRTEKTLLQEVLGKTDEEFAVGFLLDEDDPKKKSGT